MEISQDGKRLFCCALFQLIYVYVTATSTLNLFGDFSAYAQDLGLERLVDAAAPEIPGAVSLSSQQALRTFPAGDQIGTLFPSAKVIRGEERGDWVKVSVEGWVAKKAFVVTAADSAVKSPPDGIAIVDFSVERISKRTVGGDKDIVKLVLVVKNNTATVVEAWEAFLQARLATGHLLFTIPISSAHKPIPSGHVTELSFVWREGEDRFSDLEGRSKADMKLSLTTVEIKR